MKKEKAKFNYIILDTVRSDTWCFHDYISKYTKETWGYLDAKRDSQIYRIISMLYTPFRLVLKKDTGNIIAWQQYMGLMHAFYCKLFRVTKKRKLIIMTLIYKEEKGLKGKIKYQFFKYCLQSQYIDKCICFAQNEPKYYSKVFDMDINKFVNYKLGLEDITKNIEISNEGYLLSAGKSNRDYDFLVSALNDSNYKLNIVCDEYHNNLINQNIRIYNNTFGEDYLEMLSKCFLVVISLEDINISSGQLVFLQAMQFGKPIIVTKANTVEEYVFNGFNGYIVNKTKNDLIAHINLLCNDNSLYKKMSEYSRSLYEREFSLEALAQNIAISYHDIK